MRGSVCVRAAELHGAAGGARKTQSQLLRARFKQGFHQRPPPSTQLDFKHLNLIFIIYEPTLKGFGFTTHKLTRWRLVKSATKRCISPLKRKKKEGKNIWKKMQLNEVQSSSCLLRSLQPLGGNSNICSVLRFPQE